MTAHRDPDRMIHAVLMDGPTELADPVYDAVRARIEHKRQRVVIGPWRMPAMNKYVPIGLGAAAVVAVLVVGAQMLGPAGFGGVGTEPTASPEATASPELTASPASSSSSSASAPPLNQSFTSTQHGITMSYPEGWIAQAATEPWTDPTFPLLVTLPDIDVLHDPILTQTLFLTTASQPIGDSTPEDWVAEQMASEEGCPSTEPITVDGAAGLIGAEIGCDVAVVETAGRGYWIQLYTSDDDPGTLAPYDRAWFEEVLATVRLHPEDAVD